MSTDLPDAASLPLDVYSGWACVHCGASLAQGGVPAGRALGRIGAVRLDVDVYQCRPGRGCAATSEPTPITGGQR